MSVMAIEDGCAAAELPLVLTVEEAAAVLRIGRTLAYSLAGRYEESGGVAGIPVIRLGNLLRVPRWALLALACTGRVVALSELDAHVEDLLSRLDDELFVVPSECAHHLAVKQLAAPKSKRPKRSPPAAGRGGQQLVLLPSD